MNHLCGHKAVGIDLATTLCSKCSVGVNDRLERSALGLRKANVALVAAHEQLKDMAGKTAQAVALVKALLHGGQLRWKWVEVPPLWTLKIIGPAEEELVSIEEVPPWLYQACAKGPLGDKKEPE